MKSAFYALNHLETFNRTIKVWDFDLIAPTLDRYLYLYLHKWGLMGKEDSYWLKRFVTSGMTVLDIGSNVGLHTLMMARLVGPMGKVIGFEPVPSLYTAFEKNCFENRFSNIDCQNVALGEDDSQKYVYESALHSGAGRMTDFDGVAQKNMVAVKRLDDLCGQEKIDFIKIDVQGYELQVFQGMKGILEKSSPLTIYLEYWPRGLKASGTNPEMLIDFLKSYRFEIYRPIKDKLEPVEGPIKNIKRSFLFQDAYINLVAIRS